MNESIVNILLNWLTVSVPESSIWTIAVLVTLKRFDLLDKYRWRQNIVWLSIPILSSTILIVVLRYIFDVPRLVITLSAILSIYIGIIIILKSPQNNFLNEKIPYLKTFMLVVLNFGLLVVLTESLYIPIFLKHFGESIFQINSKWSINFLVAMPGRIIQFLIIIFILSIQNRKEYSNILHSITSDKKVSIIITMFVSVLIIFWILLINIFGDYNILTQFSIVQQLLFSVLFIVVPGVLLILMISLIILFIEKINELNRSHQNMFNNVFDDDIEV